MREIVLEAERLLDREEAHAYLKEALDLPEWYGRNLDALADCLGEMSGTRLVVKGARLLREPEGYGGRLYRVLLASAASNPGLAVILEE